MAFLSKIFGDANQRYVQTLQPLVDAINALEKDYEKLSGEELRAKTDEFKKRLADGEGLDDILPEAFAAVREASKRTLGQRHFDVQLMGGIALHQGKIAEMRTGEGKTLVATLPSYLNALTGKGVHLVTVNDYLSRRDAAWMGQIYNALGLSVGCINHDQSYLYDPTHQSKDQGTRIKEQADELDKERDLVGGFKVVHEFLRPVARKEVYDADITYGTNNEYGFDYLRDNMAYTKEGMVQREKHYYAIVDEVDSILIDEARTPLIISAPDTDSTKLYETFSKIVPRLERGTDFAVDEKLKAISINESGIEKVEKALNLSNLYDEGGIKYVHHLEQALKADVLFKKDKDYVVKDGEIIIVDEFTGRLMPGRRWSEGLHQAVEAKEGVIVQKESRTLATITFQNYFRLYEKIAGMTGTAQTSAEEMHKVYNVEVATIPTNKPISRVDYPDRIYKTESGKYKAVVNEIKERHETGQPVLVGTVSIDKNEVLSLMLKNSGVPHNVLNAKNHEKEAEIIAQAGRKGGVTIATNMAGRGVDIILGGNPPDKAEGDKVRELGGLHVIGTERHEARRIDDQLRGRAGRQGDPGSSQFFVSTEDEIVRIFGGDRLKNLMERMGVGEDDMIENNLISRAIQQAQGKIEGHNFDIRKYVLEYDDVMNKHRESVYGQRRAILFGADTKGKVLDYLIGEINSAVNNFLFALENSHGEGDVKGDIIKNIEMFLGNSVKEGRGAEFIKNLPNKLDEFEGSRNVGELSEFIISSIEELYDEREKQMGNEVMRQLEKAVLLRTIDELWMNHIETMEYLRDSVRLRAYGQRDPLIEYKIEGQKLFDRLNDTIRSQVANLIFKVEVVKQSQAVEMKEERRNIMEEESHRHQESISEPAHRNQEARDKGQETKEPGRNDPCWCGSGKKYKKCHGA